MTTISILVGSQNPVKIAATADAFCKLFPSARIQCEGLSVPSGVAEQPMNVLDTRQGAINRTRALRQLKEADYYVAMEAGVDRLEDGPVTFAYVAVEAGKERSVGRSALLPLPERVYAALSEGRELGQVMDELFDTTNIKQKGGAIAVLTQHATNRQEAYTQALLLAMAPFIHPALYAVPKTRPPSID